MPKDGKYRVITFDGGGLRSVVSIIILERLVEVFPDLLERVNLFCGTSGLAPLSLFRQAMACSHYGELFGPARRWCYLGDFAGHGPLAHLDQDHYGTLPPHSNGPPSAATCRQDLSAICAASVGGVRQAHFHAQGSPVRDHRSLRQQHAGTHGTHTSTHPMLALLLCTAQGRTITPTTPRPPQGEEMFGALTLKDVPRSLIITAFQLDNGRGT